MKRVLVLCPNAWDKRLLATPEISRRYDLVYAGAELLEEPSLLAALRFDAFRWIEQVAEQHERDGLAGVVGTGDYPGCLFASALAELLGLRAPKTRDVVLFSHKFYSREVQKRLVPEATPEFSAIDPFGRLEAPAALAYPFFVKPVKGTMSIRARLVESDGDLRDALRFSWRERIEKLLLLGPFRQFLRAHSDGRVPAHYFIAESPLEGQQVTVDGFVSGGKAAIMGIVDSVMYPGTMSFQRFEYPSRLPEDVQARMRSIAVSLMEGSGFDHGCFNIEMFHDPSRDAVNVIEVNPRMSYQFADLYEKVAGTSTYAVQLALATGEAVPWPAAPRGSARAAASFVMRRFEDALMTRVPSRSEVEQVEARYPGTVIKLLCTEGERLSAQDQDVGSFRYCIVNMGAPSAEELHARYAEVERQLVFGFSR